MGAGDTDGVDANGDIIINGGTINVTGNSTFDYDLNAYGQACTYELYGKYVSNIEY